MPALMARNVKPKKCKPKIRCLFCTLQAPPINQRDRFTPTVVTPFTLPLPIATFLTSKKKTAGCAADAGWITGHSYIVYGPLINGATVMMYEGALNYPYPNRWWKMIEKYGIAILYTSPTAIRGLMRFDDDWPKRYDLSSLRLLGSVDEPINPEVWRWYYEVIGQKRCPIMDT